MKDIKSLDEMLFHLDNSKNIEINDDNIAKEFLLKNNYINTINVYKHKFHEGKNDEGKHIYSNRINFSKYIENFNNERLCYSKMRDNSIQIEWLFKNTTLYYLFNQFKVNNAIHTEVEFLKYFEKKNKNFKHKKLAFKNHIIKKNKKIFMNIVYLLSKNDKNIFVILNELKYSDIRYLYYLLTYPNKNKVFDAIYELNCFKGYFGTYKKSAFVFFNNNINYFIGIRNVVSHNKSIYFYKYSPNGIDSNKSKDINKVVKILKT